MSLRLYAIHALLRFHLMYELFYALPMHTTVCMAFQTRCIINKRSGFPNSPSYG